MAGYHFMQKTLLLNVMHYIPIQNPEQQTLRSGPVYPAWYRCGNIAPVHVADTYHAHH